MFHAGAGIGRRVSGRGRHLPTTSRSAAVSRPIGSTSRLCVVMLWPVSSAQPRGANQGSGGDGSGTRRERTAFRPPEHCRKDRGPRVRSGGSSGSSVRCPQPLRRGQPHPQPPGRPWSLPSLDPAPPFAAASSQVLLPLAPASIGLGSAHHLDPRSVQAPCRPLAGARPSGRERGLSGRTAGGTVVGASLA